MHTGQRFATQAVHAGQHPDRETGALVQPMYLTSTYVFTPEKMERFLAGDTEGMYTYGRCHNPTQSGFQEKVAVLEGAQAALATGSGMAAIALAVLGTVHSGDHLIACRTVYGGTFALFSKVLAELNIDVTYVGEMSAAALDAARRPNTKALFLETVLNPTMEVVDLDPALAWARSQGIRSIVDNTFTTPFLLRPLEHGADVVVHSTTKYLNGHGDHVGGIIVGDAATIEQLRSSVYMEMGPVPSPFACWLGLRGLKTLHLRMRAHCDNAMALATWLERHPRVEAVVYPGLENHPQHRLARQLLSGGFGGMLAFSVAGGLAEALGVLNRMKLATFAVSLGDLDTLVEHPGTLTHGNVDPETRAAMGIPDNLIRVSVGVEDIEDLIADFDQALAGL